MSRSWKHSFDLAVSRPRGRAVMWHLGGNYLLNILLVVQGLVLLPLYLKYLGDRLYGFWLASGGILAWMSVMDLGIASLVLQRCAAAYGRRDLAMVGRYWRGGVLLVTLVALLVLGVAFVLASWVPVWLRVDAEWREALSGAFLLSAIAFAINMGFDLARNFCVAVQRTQWPVFAEAAGAAIALAMTIGGLIAGWELWALPAGFLARAVFCASVGLPYAVLLARSCGGGWGLDREVLRDFGRIGPAALGSRLVGGLARQAEPLLITLFLRPELGVVFSVTQRALQAVEPFVNQVIGSTMGAFAHLIGENNRSALAAAVRRIGAVVCIGASLCGLGYCLGNEGFVHLWVGSERFGGNLLTAGLAGGSMFLLVSRLLQNLLTAAGDQVGAAGLSAGENALRLAAMLVCLPWLSLAAFPLSTVVGCGITAVLAWQRMGRVLPAAREALVSLWTLPILGLLCVALGSAGGHWVPATSWLAWALGVGGSLVIGSLVLLASGTVRMMVVGTVRAGVARFQNAAARA